MKSICWSYGNDDGRICRRLAVQFDPQRGFTVCATRGRVREPQTQTKTKVMSKTKTPPTGAPTTPATGANDAYQYRSNPEVDAEIDAHIKAHPDRFAFIQAMPRERLERTVILMELNKLRRLQRYDNDLLQRINDNPEMKQAYDTLVKNVPDDQRETVMRQLVRQTRRALGRSQGV